MKGRQSKQQSRLQLRAQVRQWRLEGKTVPELQVLLGGKTRAWVHQLLSPAEDDPLAVRECRCGRTFETTDPDARCCSDRCLELKGKDLTVRVQMTAEFMALLGLEAADLNAAVVQRHWTLYRNLLTATARELEQRLTREQWERIRTCGIDESGLELTELERVAAESAVRWQEENGDEVDLMGEWWELERRLEQ